MKGKKNKYSEYVIICRESDRDGKIEVTIIDSGITDHLISNLIRMHSRDPEKRYFFTRKKDYQIYGAAWRKQIIMAGGINNKHILELGIYGEK